MSIRLKLALWYGFFVVATVLGFGILLHFMLVAHVRDEVDRTLRSRAGFVLQFAEAGAIITGIEPSLGTLLDAPSNEFREPGVYHQLLTRDGVPDVTSINLRGQELPVTPGAELALRTRQEQLETVYLDGEFRLRMLATPVVINGKLEAVLQTAQSLQFADSTIDRFRNLLIGGSSGVIVVALLSGWYLTRKSMNPVAALTRTAEAIYRVGDLSRRIKVGRGRDELTTLGRTFNQMIDSIEQMVTSQHRFVADASHELKPPLTVIRGNAEILTRRPSPEDADEASDAILREATRMQRIVDDLLAIAELDTAAEMRFAPIEIRGLAERAVQDLSRLAGNRELSVHGDEDVLVSADVDKLERAVRNLVQNAIAATDQTGQIEVDVTRQDGMARLVVADDGHGIAPEHLPHVFDRFFRADTSRARERGGTGLGLTIVKSVAEAHGGSVNARRSALGGAEFELQLPITPPSNGVTPNGATEVSAPVLRSS